MNVLQSSAFSLLKKTMVQVFYCEFWGSFQEHFFYKTPPVAPEPTSIDTLRILVFLSLTLNKVDLGLGGFALRRILAGLGLGGFGLRRIWAQADPAKLNHALWEMRQPHCLGGNLKLF